ncbi:MAG: TIGR03905 family TSCPD domain-containing protein [Peptoniphilaceae bacterium]|nr:TIGR03905 family TSCPD domain-containing protein [Peptoniphilaceae bacterium]
MIQIRIEDEMKHYEVKPRGICATKISFDLDGNVLHNVQFTKGCNGNLKAIGKLVEGMTVEKLKDTLLGNTCGPRDTSCTDQLTRAVVQAYEREQRSR